MKAATNNGNGRSVDGVMRLSKISYKLFRTFLECGDMSPLSKARTCPRSPNLQHLVPFGLVFEHDLAQETNGWHSVVEQLVMELL